MKRFFSFDLKGKKLFPIFICFYVPFALSYGGFFLFVSMSGRNAMPMDTYLIGIGSCLVVLFATCCVFTILLSRKIVPAFSLDGVPFSFGGSVMRFLCMNVVGALLSVITLGIYAPWYLAKVMREYASWVGFRGKNLEFLGKGGRLFTIILITVCVPVVILVVLSLSALRPLEGKAYHQAILQVVSLILLVPYFYEVYNWMVNFRHGGRLIGWNTRRVEAVFRILLQMVLTIVTAGIYYPAAVLVLYRYFASKTEVLSADGSKRTFGFDGSIARGFLLMWGQILLIVVTLGVYSPWGVCKIWAWVSERSYLGE